MRRVGFLYQILVFCLYIIMICYSGVLCEYHKRGKSKVWYDDERRQAFCCLFFRKLGNDLRFRLE